MVMSASGSKKSLEVEQLLAPRDISGSSTSAGKARGLTLSCCEDVEVPPTLPAILKDYTKGAITTQPKDLLHWSAAYFRALCKGEVPPVKDRLERDVKEASNGLTKGLLRVLHKQLGSQAQGDSGALKEKWTAICLNPDDMEKLLQENDLPEVGFNWTQFIAVAAASLQEGLRETMETICFVMAKDVGHGVTITMPVEKFLEVYSFLAPRYDVDKEAIEAVSNFLLDRAKTQGNEIGPKDLKDPSCPPLDLTR